MQAICIRISVHVERSLSAVGATYSLIPILLRDITFKMASPSLVDPSLEASRSMKNEEGADFSATPSAEIASALEQLRVDKKTPTFLKKLVSHIFHVQDHLSTLVAKNLELHEENSRLRAENAALKQALANSKSVAAQSSVPPSSVEDSFEEKERLRSIVISGVSESNSPSSVTRALHDVDAVKQIFDHLEIECVPQVVFRLGKPSEGRSRLLKVVLPNTYYQKLSLRRASRLRSFSCRGVYIRPSLTKQERDRIRESRLATNRPAIDIKLTSQATQSSAVN